MAVLPVLTIPNDILTTPTEKVETYDDDLLQLIEDMKETMYAEHGIGLAANQVGKSLSLFVMDVDGSGAKVFINPEIEEQDGESKIQEGCLSIPGAFVWSDRYERVRVRYYDANWDLHCDNFTGKEAICIQHEIDHLQGKLFVDRFGPVKRDLALKKHKKFMKAKRRGKIRML